MQTSFIDEPCKHLRDGQNVQLPFSCVSDKFNGIESGRWSEKYAVISAFELKMLGIPWSLPPVCVSSIAFLSSFQWHKAATGNKAMYTRSTWMYITYLIILWYIVMTLVDGEYASNERNESEPALSSRKNRAWFDLSGRTLCLIIHLKST